jgi:NAD(P)-dependent dehydrogenase (short-subunit alcohol dehydrogenase family)
MMRPDIQPVAMVSGASRGIGAAIAEHLHRNGWRLRLGMRTPFVAPLSGPDVLAHRFDALDPSSEIAWRDATIERVRQDRRAGSQCRNPPADVGAGSDLPGVLRGLARRGHRDHTVARDVFEK